MWNFFLAIDRNGRNYVFLIYFTGLEQRAIAFVGFRFVYCFGRHFYFVYTRVHAVVGS